MSDYIDFNQVFSAELDAIRDRHNRRTNNNAPIAADTAGTDPSTALELTGIACSGGGVRSASFCLGVLQGLQYKNTLDRMDYLSTVSGGGYIGTTLTIGMSQQGVFPFGRLDQGNLETPEVRHLRDNSRYLIPNGLPTVASALVVYLRGIMMNVLVILPILLCAAAILLSIKPDTEALATNWFLFIPAGWSISSSVVIGLLLIAGMIGYAIAVSVSRILPVEQRQLTAAIPTCIAAFAALLIVLELHTVLLRLAFEDLGVIKSERAAAGGLSAFFKFLYDYTKSIVLVVSPFVLPILPFLKGLISKATTGESTSWTGLAGKLASRALLLFAAAVIPLLLWLSVMQLAYWGTAISAGASLDIPCDIDEFRCDRWPHAPALLQLYFEKTASWRGAVVPFAIAALLLFLSWPFLNVNANSLHQLYRDRLGRAFLIKRKSSTDDGTIPDEIDHADDLELSKINTRNGPYHLINTALNVPGSAFANRRGRNADFFLFSPRYIGSEATGYVDTEAAEAVVDGLNIGTAMAISGAAAAPNMGMASIRPLSATIALLNIRLGRWIRHPGDIQDRKTAREAAAAANTNATQQGQLHPFWLFPRPMHLLYEAFSKTGRTVSRPTKRNLRNERGFVFLTDGGHIDNLGIYELLRRRCKLIIAIDGEADPDFDSGSLVQVERFARIDLNVRIELNWEPIGIRNREITGELKKGDVKYEHGPHVALGLITYPPAPDGTSETGVLVYIKASLSGDETDYVLSYKKTNPDFPHETTMDQLFSEEQFEAYRALGEHIARRFLNGDDPVAAYSSQRGMLLQMVSAMLPEATPI